VPPRALIRRLHQALRIDQERRRAESEQEPVTRRLARLTARERAVVLQLADGKTSKEIARVLGISARTVEGHRHRILEKMAVHSTLELVGQVSQVLQRPARD
jgi:two-component system response regulator FixJ